MDLLNFSNGKERNVHYHYVIKYILIAKKRKYVCKSSVPKYFKVIIFIENVKYFQMRHHIQVFKVPSSIDVVYTIIFSLTRVFALVLLSKQLFKFEFPNQNIVCRSMISQIFFLNSLRSYLR